MKSLEKDPDRRQQSMSELKNDLTDAIYYRSYHSGIQVGAAGAATLAATLPDVPRADGLSRTLDISHSPPANVSSPDKAPPSVTPSPSLSPAPFISSPPSLSSSAPPTGGDAHQNGPGAGNDRPAVQTLRSANTGTSDKVVISKASLIAASAAVVAIVGAGAFVLGTKEEAALAPTATKTSPPAAATGEPQTPPATTNPQTSPTTTNPQTPPTMTNPQTPPTTTNPQTPPTTTNPPSAQNTPKPVLTLAPAAVPIEPAKKEQPHEQLTKKTPAHTEETAKHSESAVKPAAKENKAAVRPHSRADKLASLEASHSVPLPKTQPAHQHMGQLERIRALKQILEIDRDANAQFLGKDWQAAETSYTACLRSCKNKFLALLTIIVCLKPWRLRGLSDEYQQETGKYKTNLVWALDVFTPHAKVIMKEIHVSENPITYWRPMARASRQMAKQTMDARYFNWAISFYKLAVADYSGPRESQRVSNSAQRLPGYSEGKQSAANAGSRPGWAATTGKTRLNQRQNTVQRCKRRVECFSGTADQIRLAAYVVAVLTVPGPDGHTGAEGIAPHNQPLANPSCPPTAQLSTRAISRSSLHGFTP